MTTTTEADKRAEASLVRDWINFAAYHLRPYLGGRRGLILLSVAALGVGGVLSWDWLVAVGLAPLIVALAPCAVMCGLGLCMGRGGGQSCSTQSSAGEDIDASSSRSAVRSDIPARPPNCSVCPGTRCSCGSGRRRRRERNRSTNPKRSDE